MWLFAFLIALFVGDFAYYAWPVEQRPDAGYVGQGVQAMILWVLAYKTGQTWARSREQVSALVFLCLWGVFEALQRSICGLLEWGAVSDGIDLCRKAMGPDVKAAVAAASCALPLYLFLRARRG